MLLTHSGEQGTTLNSKANIIFYSSTPPTRRTGAVWVGGAEGAAEQVVLVALEASGLHGVLQGWCVGLEQHGSVGGVAADS